MSTSITRITTIVSALTITLACQTVNAQERIKLKAVGQPLATGLIQKNKEQPFFEQFSAKTGLPIDVDYKPIDTTGIKDTEQLRVMRAGLFDIVSLRVLRNSRDEPTLLGLDLVGVSPDYTTGKKVTAAYFDTIDARLQSQFNAKLLGVWPFGPQILFCKKPIAKLADLRNMKVRVIDQNMAKFIETVGAIPVPMAFAETHQALSLGVVDCAVTDPSSANSAGWPEVTTHQMALGFQMSPNAYAMTMKAWTRFSPAEQAKIQGAFQAFSEELWKYSEELWNDALRCNAGQEPCANGKKFKLTNVPVVPSDVKLLQDAVVKVSVPSWAEVCDKSNPSCSQEWKSKVAPVIGLR